MECFGWLPGFVTIHKMMMVDKQARLKFSGLNNLGSPIISFTFLNSLFINQNPFFYEP